MKKEKVRVSERAVVQRLNRVLKQEDLVLKKSRPTRYVRSDGIGDWYVLDFNGNYIAQKDVDVEDLARKHKVLADWEEIVGERKEP